MTSTSNKIDTELKHKIKVALKRVAVQEHSDHNKQMLKDMPGRISLACPYCGDSHSDTLKKRGNLYWNTLQYHCYNCGQHADLYQLLKDFNQNVGDRDTSIQILDYIKEVKVKQDDIEVMQPVAFDLVNRLSIERSELKRIAGLTEIEPGDWVWFKLRDRLLSKDLNRFLWSQKDWRLWILNTNIEGKIIGAQTRKMKGNGPKYLTYDLPKILERNGQELDLNESERETITKISSTFGIMRVNFTQPVTIFEGPLDSMFMHNSLALSSAGKDTKEFDEISSVRYLFDNDETGRDKMIQKLKRGRPVFMWTKFINENKLDTYDIKDLNDLMIVCFKHKLDAYKRLDEYFTTSHLDLWYI